jgi:25S rRNA (adenine2142-N1)-methyltransferase
MLQEYSSSMLKLATEHWSKNSELMGRINWIHSQCLNYFFNNGQIKQRELEAHKLSSFGCLSEPSSDNCEKSSMHCDTSSLINNIATMIYVLDVGSCYNPFAKFPVYNVLPIDIAPGQPDVINCDFLQVEIVSEEIDWENSASSAKENKIARNSFDVVIFSLLLEYFPSPDLRFKCCVKAYEILKSEGLLFIITPDSKHATANAKIMKKWRMALATIGFWRINYEKLKHIHCMVFCKSRSPTFPKIWVEREAKKCTMQEEILNASNLITIPQDYNSSCNPTNQFVPMETNPLELVELFKELPTIHI